jgi:uncharacterized tellurite resistance protein B-like protein
MFGRIKALLAEAGASGGSGRTTDEDAFQLAVAVLLMEAARMDERIEPAERRTVVTLLVKRFGLATPDAEALVQRAEVEAHRSSELFTFTRRVSGRMSPEERVGLVEMLWEVAYADGVLDDYESNLMRRLAGLLHVEDVDSGAARQRVLGRLGRGGTG